VGEESELDDESEKENKINNICNKNNNCTDNNNNNNNNNNNSQQQPKQQQPQQNKMKEAPSNLTANNRQKIVCWKRMVLELMLRGGV
jgi:hypothetical protein